jgi:hypothetical protein
LSYPPKTIVFADGVPFYLGFYTGYNPWDSHLNYTGIYSNPVFGWGEFVNHQGVIQMLDSGLEIEGAGIYAGTQNIIAIPEPSAYALFCIGVLLIGSRTKRPNKKSLEPTPVDAISSAFAVHVSGSARIANP